jgi:hypothetical protein
MIFARYMGTDKAFTVGKVYIAQPEFDSSDTVSFGFIEVIDDAGHEVRVEKRTEAITQKDVWDFEFLGEVYAVVVKPFQEDLQVGQVVVIDDASFFNGDKKDGGKWSKIVYEIKGVGFWSSDGLVLLDRTNVFPGLSVKEESTGRWLKIKSVDECLWVVVDDGSTNRRSPEEFRFAVDHDGDIQVEPIVECIDPGRNLTKGKRYYILSEEGEGYKRMFKIVNDFGVVEPYFSERFRGYERESQADKV